jgi:hypothetical protein
MESKTTRVKLQYGVYKVIDPFVKLLLKIGFTPNLITIIGFFLNLGVAAIFVVGASVVIVVIFHISDGQAALSSLLVFLICWMAR